ncbi:MAG: PfkB family carbohydrate kinase [Pseudomonadota bacterium]
METDDKSRKGQRATIKDVARLANVSIATVSNVVNGTKPVRAQTRLAVEHAIQALDYRPQSMRRGPFEAAADGKGLPRLIVVGYVSLDFIATLPSLPTQSSRVTAESIEKMLGGPAANVASMAAGLGPPFSLKVELVTQMGDDEDSAWAIDALAENGVDTAGAFRRAGERLSRCMVLVTQDGRHTIINELLSVPQHDLLFYLETEERPARRTCIHVEGFQLGPLAPFLPGLREHGFLLSTHGAGLSGVWRTPEGLHELQSLFNVVFLDAKAASEATGLAGTASFETVLSAVDESVQSAGQGRTIVTWGGEGAVLLRPGAPPLRQKAPEVKVADTTGAGDAFAGIYLASWLRDGDEEAAVLRAVHGAALTVTAVGAQGRFVRADDLPLVSGEPTAAP